MPRSSARWMVAIDSASSRRAVELAHAHATEADRRNLRTVATQSACLHALPHAWRSTRPTSTVRDPRHPVDGSLTVSQRHPPETGIPRAGGAARAGSLRRRTVPGRVSAARRVAALDGVTPGIAWPLGRQAQTHGPSVSGVLDPLDETPLDQRVRDSLNILAAERPLAGDVRDGLRTVSARNSTAARAPGVSPWTTSDPSSARASCRTSGRSRRTTSYTDSGRGRSWIQAHLLRGSRGSDTTSRMSQ